jgi:hypothetical protein
VTTHLAQPVVLGSQRLAPTTELAGLADLARLTDDDERLQLICEIAAAIKAEDQVRDHIRALRAVEAGTPLPSRRPTAPQRRSA